MTMSKYPPAEPGALRFEPLKAAVAAGRVTLIRFIASPTALEMTGLGPYAHSRTAHHSTRVSRPQLASHLPIKARSLSVMRSR